MATALSNDALQAVNPQPPPQENPSMKDFMALFDESSQPSDVSSVSMPPSVSSGGSIGAQGEPGVDIQARDYTKGRPGGREPQYIVLHSSDGNEESGTNTLTSGGVSSHYFSTKNRGMLHFVSENDTAWHGGKVIDPKYQNSNTIGIEQEHVDGKEPWDDTVVQQSAKQAADIMRRKPWITLDHIIGHSDIAPERKQDPLNYPWDKFRSYVQGYLGTDNRGIPQAQQEAYQQQDIGPDPWDIVMANLNPGSTTTGALFQVQQHREQGTQPNLATLRLRDNVDASQLFPNVQGQQQGQQQAPYGSDIADTLNTHFQGVLKNHGAEFVAAGNKYGINPTLLAAISSFETGNGTSTAARSYNNVAGMMDPTTPDATGFKKFGSVEEGIDAAARHLKENYFDKGLTNLPDIAAKYAPVGAKNDPQGTNASWAPSVANIMRSLGNKDVSTTPLLSEPGDVRLASRPASFGMRVATPTDVEKYNAYVQNGGDTNILDPYDKLAVALAKDPLFLTKHENVQAFQEMVRKPLETQEAGKTFGAKLDEAMRAGWQDLTNIGAGVKSLVRTEWKDAWPRLRYVYSKWTGQQPDQESVHGTAELDATTAQITGRAVQDTANLVGNTLIGIDNLGTMFDKFLTSDPAKRQQLDNQHLYAMQDLAKFQQDMGDLGRTFQGAMAQAYSVLPAASDLSAELKKVNPNPKAVAAGSLILQTLTPFAAERIAAETFPTIVRPLFFEKGIQVAGDASLASSKKYMMDELMRVPPSPGEGAATVGYTQARTAQAALAPEARAATAQAAAANQALQEHLTSLTRIAGDPGAATYVMSSLANMGADTLDLVSKSAQATAEGGDRFLNAISFGSPTIRALQEKFLKSILYAHGAHSGMPFIGRLMEMGVDVAEHLPELPKVISPISDAMRVMGKELMFGETTIPYWTRVSQGTKLVSPRLASFLDSPGMLTLYGAAKGGIANSAVGGAIGALTDQDKPLTGAVAGAMYGGTLGMVGGGFGQWLKYDNPQQFYMAARGDFKRARDMLSGSDKAAFDAMPGKDKLMIGTYMQQHPGLQLGFENRPAGVQGYHTFTDAGQPKIMINLANPESAVRGLVGHELMHHVQTAGMMPDVYDALFGNPQRGTPGQYTALTPDGKPIGIDPTTGRYRANQQFENYKNQYTSNLARSGEPTAHLTNLDIAKEIFAEHGVDYLLSNRGAVDANSAFRPGWIRTAALKDAYAKMGFAFDGDGNFVQGTNLFDNMQRNDVVNRLTGQYLRTKWNDRKVNSEDQPTRRFTKEDLKNPNVTETFLDTAPEIMRNPDGAVMRDKNSGLPIMRSPSEVKAYNAKLASDIYDRVAALPENQRLEMGQHIDKNGAMFMRYLDQGTRDALAKSNQYNPHQIAGLNALSEMLADKTQMGTLFRVFNHKALSEGKRYRGFEGTEKFVIPYGMEVTKAGNVNVKTVEMAQLTDNYIRNAKRAGIRGLWDNPGDFTQDANTYFQNHAAGRPGADTIGIQKRDAINSLLGFDTQVQRESNPLLGQPSSPRARSVIKSLRIDRMSQVTPLEKTNMFNDLEQYRRMNMNFRPRTAQAEAVPDETAIPVTMRQNKAGKTVPEKIDYGITSAPLVADKQPPAITKGSPNNFDHIDFLTKPDQQKLTHFDNASAVTTYADKLVEEYGKWTGNKDVMKAKKWYTENLGLLKKSFGPDAELFAHLLAATSPQQGVVQNWHDARVAYEQYRKGAYDDAIAEYKRTGKITEDMKPKKPDGAKFGLNSDAVLKVLAGTWLDSVEGPKTPNFFANLFQRGVEATIDKWAGRTMRRMGFDDVEGAPQQWRLQPNSEAGVTNLDFAFSQQAFRQAADRLGMQPHELQAILWYAEKHHWAEKGWAKGGAAAAKASYIPMLREYAKQKVAERKAAAAG